MELILDVLHVLSCSCCRLATCLAEAVRFELTNGFPSLVFKTSAFNHSATLPIDPRCFRMSLLYPTALRRWPSFLLVPPLFLAEIAGFEPALPLRTNLLSKQAP